MPHKLNLNACQADTRYLSDQVQVDELTIVCQGRL